MARKREAAALARLRLDAGLHAIGATGLVAAAAVFAAARAGDALGPAYPLKAVAWPWPSICPRPVSARPIG